MPRGKTEYNFTLEVKKRGYQSISQLANKVGTSKQNLRWRIRKYGVEKAISMGPTRKPYWRYRGYTKTPSEWVDLLKIPKSTVYLAVRRLGVEGGIHYLLKQIKAGEYQT